MSLLKIRVLTDIISQLFKEFKMAADTQILYSNLNIQLN